MQFSAGDLAQLAVDGDPGTGFYRLRTCRTPDMNLISLGREPLGDKTGVVAHAAFLWWVFASNNVPFIVGAVCDRAVIDRAYSYVFMIRHVEREQRISAEILPAGVEASVEYKTRAAPAAGPASAEPRTKHPSRKPVPPLR